MHYLHAVIVPSTLVAARPDVSAPGKAILLTQGFCMIPVTNTFYAAKTGGEPPAVMAEFEFLTDEFAAWLCTLSASGMVAYVETDYFGGAGSQGAALFKDGRCTWGPASAEGECINEVLGLLGVTAVGDLDEFDTLGLGRHRSTEGWLDSETG